MFAVSFIRHSISKASLSQQARIKSKIRHPIQLNCNWLSSSTPPLKPIGSSSSKDNQTNHNTTNNTNPNRNAPKHVTFEMAKSVLHMSQMYVDHGLSGQRLTQLCENQEEDLVLKWQSMMEAFLAAQVHTLAGFGYGANEAGLQLYNVQVAQMLQQQQQSSSSSTSGVDLGITAEQAEELRIAGRNLWRSTLSKAFDVSLEEIERQTNDMEIPRARDLMHQVSSRMQNPKILEMIAQETSTAAVNAAPGMELNAKHTMVQRILVNEVYLGGNPCLVEQCGFEPNAKGYVLLQCIMAEYQQDPLIAQYIGGAMMRVLQSAGLDPASMQKPKNE